MAVNESERLSFIEVASTGLGPHPHPVVVGVHPAGVDTVLVFSIGQGVANVGGEVPLSKVLNQTATGLRQHFAPEFDAAELHWLVPHLVRLHAGEDAAEDIVSDFHARHGRPPRHFI